jgi:hypothetical protein
MARRVSVDGVKRVVSGEINLSPIVNLAATSANAHGEYYKAKSTSTQSKRSEEKGSKS